MQTNLGARTRENERLETLQAATEEVALAVDVPTTASGVLQRFLGPPCCLTPGVAVVLGLVFVLVGFLLTRAVLQWQMQPDRRVRWVEQGRVPVP